MAFFSVKHSEEYFLGYEQLLFVRLYFLFPLLSSEVLFIS